MTGPIKIVKIGGNVVDNPVALKAFAKDFASLPGPKILVHGGGKEATRLSGALGIETTMIEGRRVTSRPTLDVVTMVYAGLVNKRVVCELQDVGCDALGLSGADGCAITAKRRSPLPIDYGYVGDLNADSVNTALFVNLLEGGITPIVCAVMYDGQGGLLNCNADSVAAAVAMGMSRVAPTELVYCFEKPGVLRDVNDNDSVIAEITAATFPELKESGVIAAGMVPKVTNALNAVASGVRSVRICDSHQLLSDNGTFIR